MSTHMRSAETWSIPGASHWVTFRDRGYQVLLLLLLFNCCLCCSLLFIIIITVYLCSYFIYRPPRRKVNIIYSMPPACRTPKPCCKCEQSATSEKKMCKKLNTVNTMNAMNTRALVGPVAICGFLFLYSCYGTTSSAFPLFHIFAGSKGKLQIKSDGCVWVILYRIIYYYIL